MLSACLLSIKRARMHQSKKACLGFAMNISSDPCILFSNSSRWRPCDWRMDAYRLHQDAQSLTTCLLVLLVNNISK